MDYLSFWGKARSTDAGKGCGWHPLAFHSLDAAAAGEALLAAHSGLTDRFCGLFGLPRSKTVALLRFLICLHDIGKFAGRFQAKAPERFPSCFGVEASTLSSRFDYGLGGLRLFMENPDIFGAPDRRQARRWLPIVSACPHGAPSGRACGSIAFPARAGMNRRGPSLSSFGRWRSPPVRG